MKERGDKFPSFQLIQFRRITSNQCIDFSLTYCYNKDTERKEKSLRSDNYDFCF